MLDTVVSLLSASGLQALLPRYGGWTRAVSEQLGSVGDTVSGLGGIAFEALPRYGGWFFKVIDDTPRFDALVASLGDFTFQTLPRYGGWFGGLF